MNRFSVIITAHNRPALLARAVRSVKAQGRTDIQTIVVSDSPREDLLHLILPLLGDHDLFIQRFGNPGPAASRNIGMRALDSVFTLFLDDDDELSRGFLDAVEPYAARAPGSVLFTDFTVVAERDGLGEPERVSEHGVSLADHRIDGLHIKNFIPNSCLVYPTQVLRERTFDTTLVLNEDWDFILNCLADRPLRHVPVPGPIIHKREGADHRGGKNDHLLLETYLRIYKQWPAPTMALKAERQALLQTTGVTIPFSEL